MFLYLIFHLFSFSRVITSDVLGISIEKPLQPKVIHLMISDDFDLPYNKKLLDIIIDFLFLTVIFSNLSSLPSDFILFL